MAEAIDWLQKGEPASGAEHPIELWEVRLAYLDRNGSGKLHSKSAYTKTRGEAVTKLRELQKNLDDGLPITHKQQKISTFLEQWIGTAANELAPATAASYRETIRNRIIPHIGNIPLAKLSPQHVESMKTALFDRGLSANTVRIAHAVLRSALSDAEIWGLVPRNVAKLVKSPTIPKIECLPLTYKEATLFLDVARNDRYYALFVLALGTGLHQGELLALRWGDICFDTARLRVHQNVQRIDRKFITGTPKSEKSRRWVPLADVCLKS